MPVAVVSFFVIFVLITSGGLLLFYRQVALQRLSDVVTPRGKRVALLDTIEQTGFSLGGMVGRLGRVLPNSQAAGSMTEKRLINAGYRESSAAQILYGAKLLVPAALCLLAAAISGFTDYIPPIFTYASALGIGFILPDIWLARRIATRQKQIRLGLPDALDFLVVCIEAGMSMDQATARTARELHLARPALSDELDVVVLEQRAGRARSDAWRQFAERTEEDTVRTLVSVIVQSEQLGTSIAKTLRVHADTVRLQRRQQVEEKAAKTTVKLVFPLVLLVFPSIFVVALGPAAIMMVRSFTTVFVH